MKEDEKGQYESEGSNFSSSILLETAVRTYAATSLEAKNVSSWLLRPSLLTPPYLSTLFLHAL